MKLLPLIALAILVISCTITGEITNQEPIKIGAITPLTGNLAILGESAANSLLIAKKEINPPIKLIIEDSQGKIDTAITAFNKLVEQDKVDIIIDIATSGEAVAIATKANEKEIPHLSTLATSTKLIDAGPYTFKLREANIVHVEKILNTIENMGYNQIDIIHKDDETCTDITINMIKKAPLINIKILSIEKYSKDETDYRTQILKTINSPAKAVYICGFYKDLAMLLKQAKELGLNKQIFSFTTFENQYIFDIAGNAAEGTIFTASPLNCKEEAKHFCEKYKEIYNKPPDYRGAYAYDALKIAAKAINSQQGIIPGLLSTNHSGATGTTIFDKKGNAVKGVIVKQVKDGEFSILSSLP